MATVLYITAHPNDSTTSYSLAVGDAFIQAYREAHSGDHVIHLDLYRMNIPYIDADVFSGWGKLRSGSEFNALTADEKAKVSRLGEIVDQFAAADKFVFATPMWNFSFPPLMKAYIDAICVAGKTFKYTETGPVGLMQGKKAVHIQASGGIYSEGPAAGMEMGHRYLQTIAAFIGLDSMEGLFVEGHAAAPDKAEDIKKAAMEKARTMAKSF